MRQKVDEGPWFIQKTPDAPGVTLSEMNVAPMAFNLNQSSVVCLPLVSDSQRLIWVHSNEIDLQLDGAAELDKAFDRFPYMTQKQTAALAQLCSLHPDQVKVWFMFQRLRYGISWDYKDISMVRRKIKSSRGKGELQNSKGGEVKEDEGENKKCITPSGKKTGEVRDEQSASDGRMMEKDKKVENKMKKRRMTVTAEVGKKRMKQGEENVSLSAAQQQGSHVVDTCTFPTRKTKTQTQLTMMKEAFLDCEYPNAEEYSRLSLMIDIPRYVLVQWFGDMRYYIKKVRPGWMTEEQHKQALANIRYRQCLQTLLKTQEESVLVSPEKK